MRVSLVLPLLLAAAVPARAAAQPATSAVYAQLALRCLRPVPDTVRAFRFDAADRMPYLRPGLTSAWQADGYAVFLADSARAGAALPELAFRIEDARVAYDRAGRRRYRRTVLLALHHTLSGSDGRILREDRCREQFADTLRAADVVRVESLAHPETQGLLPEGNLLRRYLEPAVLTGAVAVVVLLFFSLRSRGTD